MTELLLGSGNSRAKRIYRTGHEEWEALTTLDIDPNCKPDIVWDLNELPLPFEDNTFDEIHSVHCLEHHGGPQGNWRAFFDFFSDIWRILKPNGYFFGIVPALSSRWLWTDPGHVRAISLETLMFLDQDEYKKQIGVTNMTDYRHWYKADFALRYSQEEDDEYRFILEAIKPSRLA